MDLQGAFSIRYPFLKIEFLENKISGRRLGNTKIDPRTFLKQLINLPVSRKIDIDSQRTVSELLRDFENIPGIIVQVSRKSGNVWNRISVTDGWTLESQNSAGEFISLQMAQTPIKPSVKW